MTTVRSEKINTRDLLNGNAGDANYTDPRVRIEERARVLDYWPTDLTNQIRDGFLEPPPWRLLLDPTHWKDVAPSEVHGFFRDALSQGKWPSLDATRRRFGRVSNHRSGGEVPAQESLPLKGLA